MSWSKSRAAKETFPTPWLSTPHSLGLLTSANGKRENLRTFQPCVMSGRRRSQTSSRDTSPLTAICNLRSHNSHVQTWPSLLVVLLPTGSNQTLMDDQPSIQPITRGLLAIMLAVTT